MARESVEAYLCVALRSLGAYVVSHWILSLSALNEAKSASGCAIHSTQPQKERYGCGVAHPHLVISFCACPTFFVSIPQLYQLGPWSCSIVPPHFADLTTGNTTRGLFIFPRNDGWFCYPSARPASAQSPCWLESSLEQRIQRMVGCSIWAFLNSLAYWLLPHRFYVNIYTKKSTWEKPTEPVYPRGDEDAPPGPPPGYSTGFGGADRNPTDSKTNPYNDYNAPGSSNTLESDAALAARLQAEEDARASSSSRNAQQDYQNTPLPPQEQQGLPLREERSKGLFGKLFGGKTGGSSSRPYGNQPQYGQPQYGQPQQPYYPQQQYPPPQQYPQQYPQQGYGGGYGGGYAQQPPKKSGGIGTMGGAALGLGGGLIGGMLLEDA